MARITVVRLLPAALLLATLSEAFVPVSQTSATTSRTHDTALRQKQIPQSSTTLNVLPLAKYLGLSAGTATAAAVNTAGAAAAGTAVAATAKVAVDAASSGSAVTNNSLLGGALSGIVEKFLISPARFAQVMRAVTAFALQDYKDWCLILMCCLLPIPTAKKWYAWKHRKLELDAAPMERKFRFSKTRKIAQLITEVGELFGLLFGTELLLVFFKELGFDFVLKSGVHQWATGIVATIWIAKNVSELKKYIVTRRNRMDLATNSGARLVNQFLDIAIVVATTLAILDFLSVKTGFALRSLLGFSSVGTLVFSLASQNLASEFLASLAIQGTNMYQEGDLIVLGDGTIGLVQKMGWLNTHLRVGNDNIVRVPNSQIAGSRLANVSRQKLASVQVTLDISYQEIPKLPVLVGEIKNNIVDAVKTAHSEDALVMDGSRPFRVHWREMTEWSVQVVIDTHLRVRPLSDDYWNLRQAILLAIAKATEARDIKFAYKDKNKMTPINTMPGLTFLQENANFMNEMPQQFGGSSSSGDTNGDITDLNMGGRMPLNTPPTNGEVTIPDKQMP